MFDAFDFNMFSCNKNENVDLFALKHKYRTIFYVFSVYDPKFRIQDRILNLAA